MQAANNPTRAKRSIRLWPKSRFAQVSIVLAAACAATVSFYSLREEYLVRQFTGTIIWWGQNQVQFSDNHGDTVKHAKMLIRNYPDRYTNYAWNNDTLVAYSPEDVALNIFLSDGTRRSLPLITSDNHRLKKSVQIGVVSFSVNSSRAALNFDKTDGGACFADLTTGVVTPIPGALEARVGPDSDDIALLKADRTIEVQSGSKKYIVPMAGRFAYPPQTGGIPSEWAFVPRQHRLIFIQNGTATVVNYLDGSSNRITPGDITDTAPFVYYVPTTEQVWGQMSTMGGGAYTLAYDLDGNYAGQPLSVEDVTGPLMYLNAKQRHLLSTALNTK